MKAVVLAGGKSSRMGQDKALLMLGEKVIIQRILDVVSTVFDEVYISGNRVAYQSFSKNCLLFQYIPLSLLSMYVNV